MNKKDPTIRRFGFTTREYEILSRLNTPVKIQDFLDRVKYNLEEDGETLYSPRSVLKHRSANCIEGAIFAAAALRVHGYPPLNIVLNSIRDDDHVLAVYKQRDHWGALSKSKYSGLSFREPVHRTLRELALSYFEFYFNYDGEKTLRGYSRPVNLARFDKRNWMTSGDDLFYISDYLGEIAMTPLFTPAMARGFRDVSPLMKESGELWMIKKGILKKLSSKKSY